MKEITIYNTRKNRLETVRFEFTAQNTTWFAIGKTKLHRFRRDEHAPVFFLSFLLNS